MRAARRHRVATNDSHERAYYCSYVSGFTKCGCGAEPGTWTTEPPPDLTDGDLERAVAALSGSGMLVLRTDRLDTPAGGWRRLAGWLNGSRAGEALAVATPPTPVNVGRNHDEPSAPRELREACSSNAYDCRLFARLRNEGGCACGYLWRAFGL